MCNLHWRYLVGLLKSLICRKSNQCHDISCSLIRSWLRGINLSWVVKIWFEPLWDWKHPLKIFVCQTFRCRSQLQQGLFRGKASSGASGVSGAAVREIWDVERKVLGSRSESLWHELQISLCKPSDVLYFVWIQKIVIRMWDPIYAFIKRFIVCFHKHLVYIIGNASESSSSNTMRNIFLLVVTMLFAKIVHSRYVWFRWH